MEEYFNIMVMVQIAKASEFYDKMERHFQLIISQMKSRQLASTEGDDETSTLSPQSQPSLPEREILRISNQVDHLRRFVVLNYIAVLKILKKHDKMTGLTLRYF